MKKTYIFYSLCVLCLFVFVFQFVKFSLNPKYDFKVLSHTFTPINVILSADIKNDNDILIKTDNNFYTIKNKNNIANKIIKNQIKTLDILVNKNFKKEIKDIVIFSADKTLYFKSLSELNFTEQKFCKNNICEEYISYSLSEKIKDKNKNEILNTFSWLNIFCNLLLSLFLSNPYLLLSYCLFFFLIFYFINNKNEINLPRIKISPCFVLISIFLIGVILRFDNLFVFLPYADEIASIDYTTADFLKTFSDPGNPPFFYVLLYFWFKIFIVSVQSAKIFPYLISILAMYAFLWVLKKEFGKKTAIIGLFLYAINIPLIHFSHEIRCYILQVLFCPCLLYLLFKVLRKNNIKYSILYGFLGIMAINTHYYEALFLIFNFIFGLGYFIFKKRNIKSFIILNFVIFSSFLPFFFYTALNKGLLDTRFNSWIPTLSFKLIQTCMGLLFGGFISFILSTIFLVKINLDKINPKKRLYINYCFLSIVFVFACGIIISLFRPMLVVRYLILLVPIFIFFLSLIFSLKYKKMVILFLIWTLCIQMFTFVKNLENKATIKILLDFTQQYKEKNKENEHIYMILDEVKENMFIVNKYFNYKINVKVDMAKNNTVDKKIEEILNKDEKALIFTFLFDDYNKILKNDNYKCYFNSAIDLCLFKIEK